VPYGRAAEIMQTVGDIDISTSSVWRRVERWGRRFQEIEARQQVKAYELDEPKPIDPNRSLGRMGVAMDGTMVPIREEGWKELKVGCVFEVSSRLHKDPHTKKEVVLGSAANNTYVAHLGGPEVFGRQLWAEARSRHWMHAEDTLAIGDGATWIWNLVSEHFYASHQMVDWFHATQHIADAAQTIYEEGTPAAKRWFRRWETKLYQGRVRQLVKALNRQAIRQPHIVPMFLREISQPILQQAGYFRNNAKRMNYLDMRLESFPRTTGDGYPIRSSILSKRFDKMWDLAYNSPPT